MYLGGAAEVAQAAQFTFNIFDLRNNLRNGQAVTVTVTLVDADGNTLAAVTHRGMLKLFRAATPDELALRHDSAQALPNAAQ